MRIGLISDTHIPLDAKILPHQVKEVFDGVDLILHAGDIFSHSVLDDLGEIAPVLAAKGDDDLLPIDERLKEEHFLTIEGFSVHLTHILPYRNLYPWLYYPGGLHTTEKDFDSILDEVIHGHENIPDIMIFGDTHKVLLKETPDLILINPGSPTVPNYKSTPGTVAILSINHNKVNVNIIQLAN